MAYDWRLAVEYALIDKIRELHGSNTEAVFWYVARIVELEQGRTGSDLNALLHAEA